MIAGTYDVITIYLMDVNGIYKAVNITGGPQVVIQGALGVISVKTSKGTLIRGMPGLLMVFMFFFPMGIVGHVVPSVHKGFVGSTVWHGHFNVTVIYNWDAQWGLNAVEGMACYLQPLSCIWSLQLLVCIYIHIYIYTHNYIYT